LSDFRDGGNVNDDAVCVEMNPRVGQFLIALDAGGYLHPDGSPVDAGSSVDPTDPACQALFGRDFGILAQQASATHLFSLEEGYS